MPSNRPFSDIMIGGLSKLACEDQARTQYFDNSITQFHRRIGIVHAKSAIRQIIISIKRVVVIG